MDNLCELRARPFRFLLRYVGLHPLSHAFILTTVLLAVGCSVSTQYGVKFLVDTLSHPGIENHRVWRAFGLLVALIAADNLLWRAAGWVASNTFVCVTGDLRADLFRHLLGHSPTFFADRRPGMLSSRITAASNAVFQVENMFLWNVMPPCVATLGAIALMSTISLKMTAGLLALALLLIFLLFRLAAAGAPLHLAFADRAARVDGEIVDVISNMPVVRAFSGWRREQRRFEAVVGSEMRARRRSLLYLEKLRLFHAVVTVILTVGLLAWAVLLWQRHAATTGDVVLVTTLGLTILHATRDLAVALVDATQHIARLAETLRSLLIPHEIDDHPQAYPLVSPRGSAAFENVRFTYPGGREVFENFNLRIPAGQRLGLVGRSGAGKSTLFALLQRHYEVAGGRILIDGHDISRVTLDSLHQAIGVVPQDITLFHRSIMENIRYARPDASDEEVWEAATAAHCRSFIDAFPEGMATIVGERGMKLSGGQRQRIAIARALLKDAPILLLDEATSAQDSESEEEIREALDRLMQRRTVIAIAHRLSTLRNFDRIVVLQAGRVLQDGPPDKLMQYDGMYRNLVEREVARLAG